MTTQEEIVKRIEAISGVDFFGFEKSDLLSYLDFEHAQPYLKATATATDWGEAEDQSQVRNKMLDYMPFAWEKACGCRGLSAARSLNHFSAWLWIAGNEELAESIRDYEYYGKPQLIEICKWLGVDHQQWDDGMRTNSG